MNILLFVFLISTLICGILIIVFTIKNGISPLPSSPKAARAILSLLHNTESKVEVYELGSGWGTLCFTIAREFPEKRISGFENSWPPYLFSLVVKKLFRFTTVTINRLNFYNFPINNADIVICYLYPEAMNKLKDKFEQELKPGAIVISNTFGIPGWQASNTIELQDMYRSKVYKYVKI